MSRRSWSDSRPGVAATVVIALVAVLLSLVTLPATGPLLALLEARADKRKRAAAEQAGCGRCAAPLGEAALKRADAVFAAHVQAVFGRSGMLRARIVRDLDACCVRYGAGHRYDRGTRTFALLPSPEFERTYADALRAGRAGEPA